MPADLQRLKRFERLVRERGDLERAALDVNLSGETHVVTAHAAYRLLDGCCIGVDDLGMTGKMGTVVGMVLVGWITLEDESMLDFWEPGARAVFWRAGRVTPPRQDERFTMTSAVLDLRAMGIPKPPESGVRERRVAAPRPDVRFRNVPPPLLAGGRAPHRLPRPPIHQLHAAELDRARRRAAG